MVENPDHMKRKTHVYDRGNWLKKLEEVQAGVPQILNPWDKNLKNRLGFAKWLVDKKNSLLLEHSLIVFGIRFWKGIGINHGRYGNYG